MDPVLVVEDDWPSPQLTPRLQTALLTGALVVVVPWIGVVLFRKWFDRDSTIPGMAPSWWSPLGVEQILLMNWDHRTQSLNEVVMQLLAAASHMYNFPCGLIRGFLGYVPAVIALKAQSVEVILGSSRLIEKAIPYKFLEAWLGRSILTDTGAKWRVRRKLLTPAFHFTILENFMPIFEMHSRKLVENLRKQGHQKPIDITKFVALAALDIICETAMGVKLGAQSNGNTKYVQTVGEVGDSILRRVTKPWLWPDFIYYLTPEGRRFGKNVAVLHSFTEKVIKERKAELIKQRDPDKPEVDEPDDSTDPDLHRIRKKRPFLDLLLEEHLYGKDRLFTVGDVRAEVDTFMFEGYDTTSTGLSWTLFLLADNPDAQRKIHEELDEIFGDDLEQPITQEHLGRMKYLEACLKETLRIYPPVPLIIRRISEDVSLGDRTIKKGTTALIDIYHLHRDPEVYPKPEVFMPERFLAENSAGRHAFAYVPFSAGPRNCIGQRFAMMEEKVVLATIMRHFSFRPTIKRDQLRVINELILRAKDGLPVYVIPRRK